MAGILGRPARRGPTNRNSVMLDQRLKVLEAELSERKAVEQRRTEREKPRWDDFGIRRNAFLEQESMTRVVYPSPKYLQHIGDIIDGRYVELEQPIMLKERFDGEPAECPIAGGGHGHVRSTAEALAEIDAYLASIVVPYNAREDGAADLARDHGERAAIAAEVDTAIDNLVEVARRFLAANAKMEQAGFRDETIERHASWLRTEIAAVVDGPASRRRLATLFPAEVQEKPVPETPELGPGQYRDPVFGIVRNSLGRPAEPGGG